MNLSGKKYGKRITYSSIRKSCELVRQFPVMFDKSHKRYKEKDAEVNAWHEISNSLDFVPDGMHFILATI